MQMGPAGTSMNNTASWISLEGRQEGVKAISNQQMRRTFDKEALTITIHIYVI